MQATIIKTLEGVRALEAQWGGLTPPSPFSSWDFAYDWLRCAPEAQPNVITVHSHGELVGVAPWCLKRDYAGSRVLTGVGTTSAWYHDPLVTEGVDAAAVHHAILSTLRPRKWDAIDLTLRQDNSQTLVAGLQRLGMALVQQQHDQQCHVIPLDEDWEASWKRFPKKFRQDNRRLHRHLLTKPHRFLQATEDLALPLLEDLIQRNRDHWQTGENWELPYSVLRANTPTLLGLGDLRFFGLEIEGRMAALAYIIRKGNRSFMIIANFDPDFAEYSPSNLLFQWSLERLHQEGVRLVDMGPGEYTYKKRLAPSLIETVRTQVGTSLLGMGLVGWRGMIKPRLQTAI
jgi:CelD/BcsL family acetyltransferase involved in cellulose biosynthesis